MDQAYLELAVYVVNSVVEDPKTFPTEYGPRLLQLCGSYHKDDQWDAHLKAWDLTHIVAHDLPLNEDAETQLQATLLWWSRVMKAEMEAIQRLREAVRVMKAER